MNPIPEKRPTEISGDDELSIESGFCFHCRKTGMTAKDKINNFNVVIAPPEEDNDDDFWNEKEDEWEKEEEELAYLEDDVSEILKEPIFADKMLEEIETPIETKIEEKQLEKPILKKEGKKRGRPKKDPQLKKDNKITKPTIFEEDEEILLIKDQAPEIIPSSSSEVDLPNVEEAPIVQYGAEISDQAPIIEKVLKIKLDEVILASNKTTSYEPKIISAAKEFVAGLLDLGSSAWRLSTLLFFPLFNLFRMCYTYLYFIRGSSLEKRSEAICHARFTVKSAFKYGVRPLVDGRIVPYLAIIFLLLGSLLESVIAPSLSIFLIVMGGGSAASWMVWRSLFFLTKGQSIHFGKKNWKKDWSYASDDPETAASLQKEFEFTVAELFEELGFKVSSLSERSNLSDQSLKNSIDLGDFYIKDFQGIRSKVFCFRTQKPLNSNGIKKIAIDQKSTLNSQEKIIWVLACGLEEEILGVPANVTPISYQQLYDEVLKIYL